MARIMQMICQIAGHDWSVKGITGKYEWCKCCGARRECKREAA